MENIFVNSIPYSTLESELEQLQPEVTVCDNYFSVNIKDFEPSYAGRERFRNCNLYNHIQFNPRKFEAVSQGYYYSEVLNSYAEEDDNFAELAKTIYIIHNNNNNTVTPLDLYFRKSIKTELKDFSKKYADLLFIYSLIKIDSEDDLKAIDNLYDYIDPLLDSNAFFRIEQLIEFLVKKSFSIRLLIGFLTITHSRKNHIKNRYKLIDLVKSEAANKGLTAIQINSILKGF